MQVVLLLASIILMVSGLVLGFMARRHRTATAPPIPSFNPVHWFQPWRIPDWFTQKGQKLFYTSWVCVMLGVVCYALAKGMPPLFG